MSAVDQFDPGDPSIDFETLRSWEVHLGAPVVDPESLRRGLGEGDLASEFARVATKVPDAPALSIGGATATHGELDRAARVAAAWFSRFGPALDSPVMLIAPPSLEVVVAYLGLLRVGAPIALVNPTLTPPELARMAKLGGIEWILGTGESLTQAAQVSAPTLRGLIGLRPEDAVLGPVMTYPAPEDHYPVRPPESDRTAILAFTSGTTGLPKCAPLSHRNLLSSIRAVMSAWRWSPQEHLVHALPISHQHGLGGIHATLLAGSSATICDSFSPIGLLQTIKTVGATAVFAVPAIHQRLLAEGGSHLEALRGLRLLTSGSAPLSVELARRVEAASGQLPLERYGTTESGLDVSNPIDQRVPGTIGLPLPGVEVALVSESGTYALRGEPGEILVRGPQVFSGYRGDDDGLEQGWFRTGDVGVIDDASGHLAIVGRRKELIISGGMNVYPREVEEALATAPGVHEVAVIGVPSRKWGEEVVAFVAPSNLDSNSLAAYIAGRLAPYKRPKRIVVMEALPRSAVGKVDKLRLAAIGDRG